MTSVSVDEGCSLCTVVFFFSKILSRDFDNYSQTSTQFLQLLFILYKVVWILISVDGFVKEFITWLPKVCCTKFI